MSCGVGKQHGGHVARKQTFDSGSGSGPYPSMRNTIGLIINTYYGTKTAPRHGKLWSHKYSQTSRS